MTAGPSFLFKARQTFLALLNTSLLPEPEGPAAMEMTPMEARISMPSVPANMSPRSSSSGSSSYSMSPALSPTDTPSGSHFGSLKNSIELEPAQAACVREMIADATH